MATSQQDKAIAIRHVSGAKVAELADAYGYTYQGMLNKLKSSAMQPLLEAAHSELQQNLVLGHNMLLSNFPDYISLLDRIARDNEHKKQVDTLFKLVDKILPNVQRHEVNGGVRHELAAPQLEEFNHNMGRMLDVWEGHSKPDIRNSPHLLEGEAAVPRPIDISAEEAELE
jgi:hypothetical protein